jgi:hypothetical protein
MLGRYNHMEPHDYPETVVLPEQFGDFRWIDAHRLLRSDRRVPEKPRAYALFVRQGHRLLDRLSLSTIEKPELVSPVSSKRTCWPSSRRIWECGEAGQEGDLH